MQYGRTSHHNDDVSRVPIEDASTPTPTGGRNCGALRGQLQRGPAATNCQRSRSFIVAVSGGADWLEWY